MYERLISLIGNNNFNKLNNITVCVVGLGGVGGYAVEALARSGIKHLILIDYDVIESSNKNRQIIALDSTIGLKKTAIFKQRINDINSEIKVDILDLFLDNPNVLDKYQIDYLIDACDSINTKKNLIKYCHDKSIKMIISGGMAKTLNPEKVLITTLDKTYNDPVLKPLRKYVKIENLKPNLPVVTSIEEKKDLENKTLGSIITVPSVAGIYLASYVINDVISCDIDL